MLGWFAFAFLCAWGHNQNETTRYIIVGIGFVFCVFGMAGMFGYSNDEYFWSSIAELKIKKEKADMNIDDALRMRQVLIRKYLMDDEDHEWIEKALTALAVEANQQLQQRTDLTEEERKGLEKQSTECTEIVRNRIRLRIYQIPYQKD